MRLLGTMLPPLSPSRLKAVVECPCPACYKCLFLPLLGSLLLFFPLLVISAGFDSAFPLFAALSTLLREPFAIFYLLSLSP
jgi:hypothetical protein